MTDITQILSKIEDGDAGASEQLLPAVYEELWKLAAAKMAAESANHTLQATALVHEAYLRLVDVQSAQHWNSRNHFFSAAAEAMRRILLDRARNKRRLKRGGQWNRIDLTKIEVATDAPDEGLLAMDEALERFAKERPDCAELVKLRFFGGLTFEEAAHVMGISSRTAKRHWAYARAWLFEALCSDVAADDS